MTRLILLFGLLIVTAATFAHEPMPGALYWSAVPLLLTVGLLVEVFYRSRRNQRKDVGVSTAALGGAFNESGDMLDYVWDGFRDNPHERKPNNADGTLETDIEPLPIESDFGDSPVDTVGGGAGAHD